MSHQMVSIGSVAEFINGVAFKPDDWTSEGKKIVRIQNLTDPKKPFNRTNRVVDSKYVVHRGDLLVSWSATLGVFTWDDEETAFVNQHIFKVVPDNRVIDQGYLRHMLTEALVDMERHLHGATMKHVNRTEFLATQIPLPHKNGKPDLDEQKRIAAILDKADAIRRKRQQALRLTDDFLRSVFLDMFGDPVTNPMGWDCDELQNVVKNGTIVTYGIVQAGEEFPGGVPYIRTGDISNGVIIEEGLRHTDPKIAAKFDRSRVEYGEIVMSIRATVGTTALVPKSLHGANLTQGTARISPGGRTLLPYLHCYLRSEGVQNWIQGQVKGATFREITLGRLRELPVLLPPVSLQRDFERIFLTLSAKKIHHEALSSDSSDLFASLQQRAFRGEL